jgi:hypothetical protein
LFWLSWVGLAAYRGRAEKKEKRREEKDRWATEGEIRLAA